MNVCPKCGSSRIHGPVFVRNIFAEALKYTCLQCGYSSYTDTLDKQKAAPPVSGGRVPTREDVK